MFFFFFSNCRILQWHHHIYKYVDIFFHSLMALSDPIKIVFKKTRVNFIDLRVFEPWDPLLNSIWSQWRHTVVFVTLFVIQYPNQNTFILVEVYAEDILWRVGGALLWPEYWSESNGGMVFSWGKYRQYIYLYVAVWRLTCDWPTFDTPVIYL